MAALDVDAIIRQLLVTLEKDTQRYDQVLRQLYARRSGLGPGAASGVLAARNISIPEMKVKLLRGKVMRIYNTYKNRIDTLTPEEKKELDQAELDYYLAISGLTNTLEGDENDFEKYMIQKIIHRKLEQDELKDALIRIGGEGGAGADSRAGGSALLSASAAPSAGGNAGGASALTGPGNASAGGASALTGPGNAGSAGGASALTGPEGNASAGGASALTGPEANASAGGASALTGPGNAGSAGGAPVSSGGSGGGANALGSAPGGSGAAAGASWSAGGASWSAGAEDANLSNMPPIASFAVAEVNTLEELRTQYNDKCSGMREIDADGLCFYKAILTGLNGEATNEEAQAFAEEISVWLDEHKGMKIEATGNISIEKLYEPLGELELPQHLIGVPSPPEKFSFDEYVIETINFQTNGSPNVYPELIVSGWAAANVKKIILIVYLSDGTISQIFTPVSQTGETLIEGYKVIKIKGNGTVTEPGNHFDLCLHAGASAGGASDNAAIAPNGAAAAIAPNGAAAAIAPNNGAAAAIAPNNSADAAPPAAVNAGAVNAGAAVARAPNNGAAAAIAPNGAAAAIAHNNSAAAAIAPNNSADAAPPAAVNSGAVNAGAAAAIAPNNGGDPNALNNMSHNPGFSQFAANSFVNEAAAAPPAVEAAPVNAANPAQDDSVNKLPYGLNAGTLFSNALNSPEEPIIARGGENHVKKIINTKTEQYRISKKENDLALKAFSDATAKLQKISVVAPQFRASLKEDPKFISASQELESAKSHYEKTTKALEKARKAAPITPPPPPPRARKEAVPVDQDTKAAGGLPAALSRLPPHARGSVPKTAEVPDPVAAPPPLPGSSRRQSGGAKAKAKAKGKSRAVTPIGKRLDISLKKRTKTSKKSKSKGPKTRKSKK